MFSCQARQTFATASRKVLSVVQQGDSEVTLFHIGRHLVGKKVWEMFVTVIALKYALLVSW